MNAVLAIGYAQVPGFPAGSVVASILAVLTGASTPAIKQSVAPDTALITFANIPADTYTIIVAAQDASGNAFGAPATGSFTIAAPVTVALSLPASISATQS